MHGQQNNKKCLLNILNSDIYTSITTTEFEYAEVYVSYGF